MTAERPPLPLDDDDLEELMRTHLESVTPSAEARARTQQALQARLSPASRRPPWGWLGLGLGLLGLGILAAWPGDPEPAPRPPQATSPAPATPTDAPTPMATPADGPVATPAEVPTPVATAAPADSPAPAPTPEAELLLRLAPGEDGPEADYDYNQLHELFKADVIVAGVVAAVDDAGGGTLRVSQVLRGERAQLLEVSTAGDFTGCEGVPDFRPLAGVEVCLFLRRDPAGTLTLLHGSSGLQRLPYGGKLSLEVLTALVAGRPVPSAALLALIEAHGARVLPWLEQQLRGVVVDYGVGAADVQAELGQRLEAIATEELPRPELMGIVRALQVDDAGALPAPVWAALQAYHASFRAHALGAWVRRGADSYRNDPQDEVAFLSFLLPHDKAWVADALRRILAEIRAGAHPRAVTEAIYAPLRAQLEALGETFD